MAVKYQVFISSTYEDLKEERNQVVRAVLEMGHIPVGMEMFSAADEEQWKIIARHIDESDYYIVIVGHRYGSTVEDGRSFTQKEYEYAVSQGVPALGFIIDNDAHWPASRVDTDAESVAALNEFKALVRQKPVGIWTDASDLAGKGAVALMKAITTNPREGWVRASEGQDPAMAKELSRLSAENAALREDLAAAQRENKSSADAALATAIRKATNTKRMMRYRTHSAAEWKDAGERSLTWILQVVGASMVTEDSVEDMARSLALNLREEGEPSDSVPHNQLQSILVELMALDLVEPSKRKHSVNDTKEYWSLTELGVAAMKMMTRINAGQPDSDDDPEEPTQEAAPKTVTKKKSASKKRAPRKKASAKKAQPKD